MTADLCRRVPEELEEGDMLGDENGGILIIGSKGKIMTGCYGMNPTLLPKSRMKDFKDPKPQLRRVVTSDVASIWDSTPTNRIGFAPARNLPRIVCSLVRISSIPVRSPKWLIWA